MALRRERDKRDWIDQSLGDWVVGQTKRDQIHIIIGIDVSSREIVSIASINSKNHSVIGNKVRFKKQNILLAANKNQDQSLPILEEALIWNPQNTVRYLN